jgi:hypothetical protein
MGNSWGTAISPTFCVFHDRDRVWLFQRSTSMK